MVDMLSLRDARRQRAAGGNQRRATSPTPKRAFGHGMEVRLCCNRRPSPRTGEMDATPRFVACLLCIDKTRDLYQAERGNADWPFARAVVPGRVGFFGETGAAALAGRLAFTFDRGVRAAC